MGEWPQNVFVVGANPEDFINALRVAHESALPGNLLSSHDLHKEFQSPGVKAFRVIFEVTIAKGGKWCSGKNHSIQFINVHR